MRKLVVLVVVLASLFAIDSLARAYAEARLSSRLTSALELDSAPDVSIEGSPFLWGVIGGELDAISIRTEEMTSGPISLDRVDMQLRQVTFSPAAVFTGDLRAVRIRSGRGAARVSVTELEDELRAAGSLVGDISIEDLPGVGVNGTTLSLGPAAFDLPRFGDGMTYQTARLTDGELRLTFRFDRTKLDLN